nr:head GIN domain-containing protein [uncultured Roseateles sp.]
MKTLCVALCLVCAALLPAAQAQLVGQATPAGVTYTLGAFKRVLLEGPADIRLVQGEINQLVIEGNAEVQKRIEVNQNGGSLRIEPSGSWKFWNARKPLVLITARDLEEINIQGAGDVIADGPLKLEQLAIKIAGSGNLRLADISARQLAVTINGAGDAKVAGSVQNLYLSISGNGDFAGENLRAAKAKVSIAGVGDVNIWVTDDLVVSLSGAGSIRYWGNPSVRKAIAGVGSVTAKGDKVP